MSPRPPFPPAAPKPGKHRLFIGLMLAVVLLGGVFSFLTSGGKSTRKAAPKQEIVTITLPPPPPPPPKIEPPRTEPPPEDNKEEIVEQEPDPVEPPPEAPVEPPSEVLGTNIQGNGPGINGLGTSGNGGGNRNSLGGGGTRKARVDWYVKKVLKDAIREALERNPATRNLVFENGMRIWVGRDGRITRIQALGGASNANALEQVLVGLQTAQTPPTGMPTYIDYQMKGRKQTR